ncbi:helix-hairpin-helix domain-containing protein, partial [Pseudomonas sp. 2822-17]|uniref:ComEA family DNA-binding protein n=1 Tax=Pseudomonas sp. 2822-17 TaxID=1712678 RepID=UPI001C440384
MVDYDESHNNDMESQDGGKCIDINSASVEKLSEIIHIGETRAEELIELRPFDSLDALSKINGIGEG